VGLDELATG